MDGTGSAVCRVLVVEDDLDSAEALEMVVALTGAETFVAPTGRKALELARDVRPHLVFVDIGLPDIDGYEVCRRMRPIVGAEVVIVALSGWDSQEHDLRVRAAGFTTRVTKPPEIDHLRRILSSAQPI